MLKSLLLPFLSILLLKTAAFAQNGLKAEYFDGTNFEKKIKTRTDAEINFQWNFESPVDGLKTDNFSIRWTGKITAPESGEYLFRALVDDGIRVEIDEKTVINHWEWADSEDFSGKIYLEKGQSYDLKVEYFNGPNEGEIHLLWQLPSQKPVFGGVFGYNDQPISAKYYSKNEPKVVAVSEKETPKKAAPKVEAPPKKPVAKPAAPAKPKPVLLDSMEKYMPKNTLFEKSKATMLPGSMAELDNLAVFLTRNPKFSLRIEGHTDNVGDAPANLKLSKERAKSVADYLILKGIAENRLAWEGFGGTRPIATGGSVTANARNRRVEYFLK
jgi:outer membrane protein OmpA-like peptidoglycan-associated protein